LFVLDFASPKPVKTEGAVESSPSPAAQALSGKKAGAKQGAESFASSLEKAQGQSAIRRAELKLGGLGKLKGDGKAARDALVVLQELLGDLSERELIQVLMKASPKELLRYAESLGLDRQDLRDPVRAFRSIAASAKKGQYRDKLARLLDKLVELLGARAVADAMAAGAGKKRTSSPDEAEPARRASNQPIGEARSVGKKPTVVVVDLREDQPAVRDPHDQPGANKSPTAVNGEKTAEAPEKEGSVLFRAQVQQRSSSSDAEAGGRLTRPAPNFQSRFIPEVVKQTGIILKNGGAGEIRLVLKPENLGSVRIRVSLTESSLEGRIVVDNNSVKELVESSLDNLKNALRLEGYQTNLEVSVGHRRSSNGREQTEAPPAGWWGGGPEEFEKAIPVFLDMKPDYELVNVFA
jgi:flagellar hook-length control protein FliK